MLCRDSIYKFSGILASVLLIQCCLGKPLEENVVKSGLPPWPANVTKENMNEYFANHTIKAARQILSDASLIANHNKEVEDFKLNLTTIVSRYEKINDELKNNQNEDQTNATSEYKKSLYGIVMDFFYITSYYYDLHEKNKSNDSKFISDIITKYDGYYVYKTLTGKAYAIALAFLKGLEESLLSSVEP